MSSAEDISALPMLPVTAPRQLEVVGEYESTTSGMLVKSQVLRELGMLSNQGIDADLIDVEPAHTLPYGTQNQIDMQSEALGQLSGDTAFDTLFDPTVHSAGKKWAGVSKRAIALWALKQAGDKSTDEIAPLIDPAVYDEPLFEGRSAHDVLREEHPRSATLVSERYRSITTESKEDDVYEGPVEGSAYLQFIDKNGFDFVSSKDFLTGVLDSRAVDTRAIAASEIALQHVLANPEDFDGRPLVMASLACGAAAPMYELNQLFEANGVKIDKNILVDNDPMALASAVALARAYDMENKVDARLEDIIGKELTDYIEPHSVDVVDILGIVDYLPTSVMGYRAAENFVGKIRNILRPGGIVVAGNALKSRPHQAFFERVWPTLQQRDPVEMVDIFRRAGFDDKNIQVRVPQREGVYGVYGLKVPQEGTPAFRESLGQRAAKKVLTVATKFNKY